MGTGTLHDELAQLAGYSPAEFAVQRRHLISLALRPDGVDKAHLLELQQNIDAAMAVGATPLNCLRQLHSLLEDRLDALAVLTCRLEAAVARPDQAAD